MINNFNDTSLNDIEEKYKNLYDYFDANKKHFNKDFADDFFILQNLYFCIKKWNNVQIKVFVLLNIYIIMDLNYTCRLLSEKGTMPFPDKIYFFAALLFLKSKNYEFIV